MWRPTRRPSEHKHSSARLATAIGAVLLALVGAIFLANSLPATVTPVVTHQAPAAGPESAAVAVLTSHNGRPVYPYSIIGGGATSAEELERAIAGDPVVAAHYAGFDLAKTKVIRLDQPKLAHVSYRIGHTVYWTRKPVVIPAGETVLSDGTHMARTRCANQLEEADMEGAEAPGPVSPREPAAAVMDTPLSSPDSPILATVPSASRPSALAGSSGSAQRAASSGGGSGFGGAGGGAASGAAKKSSSASPMAAGSLGALGIQADQSADPAVADPLRKDTLARSQISAGTPGSSGSAGTPGSPGSSGTPALLAGGLPSNPFGLPGTPESIPAFGSTDVSPAAGGPSNQPGQPLNMPPGTPDSIVSTSGKELTADSVHPADVTTPPGQDDQTQGPATIPEPGTALLLIGAAAAHAARRFIKDQAPRA
jgi:uncharacterized membrane protein YgcG